MAEKQKETELEKRQRETAENNAKLEKESDDHLSKHAEHLQSLPKEEKPKEEPKQ